MEKSCEKIQDDTKIARKAGSDNPFFENSEFSAKNLLQSNPVSKSISEIDSASTKTNVGYNGCNCSEHVDNTNEAIVEPEINEQDALEIIAYYAAYRLREEPLMNNKKFQFNNCTDESNRSKVRLTKI